MKKNFLFYVIFQFLIFSHTAFGGWPEDGWFATADLDFSHRGVSLKLTNIHRDLATQERNLSRVLPAGNTTNIVLATLGVVVEGELKLYPILSLNDYPYVFESGWKSAFQNNPFLDVVQSSVNRHVSLPKKGEQARELSSAASFALMDDFENIIKLRHIFESKIRPFYDFGIGTAMPIDDVIQHGERIIARLNNESPIRTEFERDRHAYVDAKDFLKETKKKSRAELVQLSQELDPDALEDEDLNTIESSVKNHRKNLHKAKTAISEVGARIIASFWHSEQRLLHYLSKQAGHILRLVLESMSTPPEALILCLHSRFDICKVCSHSLAHSCFTLEEQSSTSSTSTPEAGILFELKRVMSDHFNLTPADFPLFITSSFREGRKDFEFDQEVKVELRDSADLLQKFPAFPMCHIPSEKLVGVE